MNAYGPTECSDDVTHHPIAAPPPAHAIRVPIGRPIANLRIHVLDARLEPAPIGVAGELYVGGAGVGRGYLNDAGRTAESFVPDPFGDTPGGRMYRTGDLGRYLPDGTIEFLGRVDQQVKIRGFRIEAGEIETVLRRHPGVTHALVLAREDTPGDPRLVAYLVADPQPDTAELAGFLKQRLPAYMVPAAFVLLEALPLTPNGKVDRRALPVPAYSRAGRADVPRTPRDEVERRLVAIWQRVLDVQPIGVDDDFFELGGHSILAVRLMAQIEQAFGRRLPLATLFERTTIEQLAQLLRNSTERHWSSLVPVQPNGAKSPFFCVHPGGGHVMAYHRLAQLLGTDRPFYGLQAIGIDGQAEPLADFELMAARYIAELRQVQPVGPYLLGGWCTGGRIAHEMACRLEAQGERVALLVFFDATPDAEGMPGPDILPDDFRAAGQHVAGIPLRGRAAPAPARAAPAKSGRAAAAGRRRAAGCRAGADPQHPVRIPRHRARGAEIRSSARTVAASRCFVPSGGRPTADPTSVGDGPRLRRRDRRARRPPEHDRRPFQPGSVGRTAARQSGIGQHKTAHKGTTQWCINR